MTHSEYERVFLCGECGQLTIVGPCHNHIDAERFRCAQCRAAADPRAQELSDAIERARRKQAAA